MSVKQEVLTAARTLGATVDSYGVGSDFEITIDAPTGFHWTANGVHCLIESVWDAEKPSDLWRDALECMGYGIEPCDTANPDCRDHLDGGE